MRFPLSLVRLSAVFVFALALAACGGGGADGEDVAPGQDLGDRPLILSTTPADDDVDVNPVTRVRFVMESPIDPASVDNDTVQVDSLAPGVPNHTVDVSGDTIEVGFRAPLPRSARISLLLRPGVRDTEGNTRQTPFRVSFDTEEATVVTAEPHEQELDQTRIEVMRMNAAGDGMSIMQVDQAHLIYRLIRDGYPFGQALPLPGGARSMSRDHLHVAPNGDAQVAWRAWDGDGYLLYLQRFDAVTETWGATTELVPNTSDEANQYASAIDNTGGVIAWTQQVAGDYDRQAVYVAFPDAAGAVSDRILLRSMDRKRGRLHLDKSGANAAIAWSEEDALDGDRVAVIRHEEVGGFSSIQVLTAAGRKSFVRDVKVAANGYRYVFFETWEADQSDSTRLYLSVAPPAQSFGTPVPIHDDYVEIGVSRIAITPQGVANILYGRLSGDNQGTWFRRYVPGLGFTDPVEFTGEEYAPRYFASDLGLDAQGNAFAAVNVFDGLGGQAVRAGVFPVNGDPIVNIVLDDAEHTSTGRSLKIAMRPDGSAFVVWNHNVDGTTLDRDYRGRTLALDGTTGPVRYYSTQSDVVVSDIQMGFAPSGRGLMLYSELFSSAYEVVEVLFP